ncbi:hypothetical protein [Mucilaginibacter antarcticus]|uniref:hypothetical protein n=1 Tax=Mucilaginibacter antarcticus TaxID=1855725 RepID=UPI00363044D6
MAYTVTIKRTNPASPGVEDIQQGNQSTGNSFEYPFTPNLGDKIEITAQSAKGSVYVYPLYKGSVIGPVNSQTTSSGGSLVTFTYTVTN